MKMLLLISFGLLMAGSVYAACPTAPATPYTQGTVKTTVQALAWPNCCCATNEILVIQYDEECTEDVCCGGAELGCETCQIYIKRQAVASNVEGKKNVLSEGNPNGYEVKAETESELCFCGGLPTQCRPTRHFGADLWVSDCPDC